MDTSEILGIIAVMFSLLINVGTVIQIQRIRKRGTSGDISIMTFAFVSVSMLWWFIYAISINDMYLAVSQGVGFIIVSLLVYFIVKYRK